MGRNLRNHWKRLSRAIIAWLRRLPAGIRAFLLFLHELSRVRFAARSTIPSPRRRTDRLRGARVLATLLFACTVLGFGEETRAQTDNSSPEFTSSGAPSVAENTTTVLTVVATDADAEDTQITYALNGGADQSKFSLSGAALSFLSAPDFEDPTDAGDTAENNTYVVEVIATSGAGDRALSATQTITVTVTNVNETPSFSASAQTRSVAENTAAETDIGTVLPAATDLDTGDSLSYSLGGTDADSFTLGSGRQLKTKNALNYEDKTSYSVTLIATDGGNLTASLAVTINVTDVNEPPSFTSSNAKSVAENTTPVLTVAATDPDSSDSVTFSLSGGADQSKFSLSGAVLSFSSAPDFEAPTDAGDTAGNNTYVVEVTATGGAGGRAMTTTQTITVTVTNVNEAPAFSASGQTRSVAENTGPGEDIGAVLPAATDPEGTSLAYTLGGTDAGSFTLGSGRQLKTKAALDFEGPKKQYSVTLRASDGSLTADLGVTISVTDVNEPPAFPGNVPSTASVDENTAAEVEFGTAIAATDPEDNALTYSVGGTDGASFGINASTGRLKTKAALDFENKNSYTVTVTASESANSAHSATTTVTINVGDVDEPPNPPSSPTVSAQTSSRLTVGWTAPSNTGRPAITGYKLSWTTSKANPVTPTPTSPIALAASETSYVVRGLDPATTYTFSIVATNDEGDGNAATVNGTTGANQAPVPDDASPAFSIAENAAANLAVGTVLAVDPETDADDNNRPVTYAMKSGDTGAFNLNPNTGQLTTKEFDYNYEADAEYNLVVSANDVHGGSADIAVTVNLTDVGGEVPGAPDPPALERFGTRVEVKYTEPPNPGPPITGYSVQHKRTDTTPEGSWSSSGCGSLRNKEDTFSCRNLVASGEYAFQVRAQNADGAGAWSGSALTDAPPPVFAEGLSDKSWAVPENTGPGVNVGDPVTATDPGGGSVTYSLDTIHDRSPLPPLTIGKTSGQLATKTGHTYDHEVQSRIGPFYVVANAAGAIARFSMSVSVTNVDEPPTGTPGGVSATAKPGGRVVVDWTKVSDSAGRPSITGYDIQYRTPPNAGSWSTYRSTATELNPVFPFGQIPVTEATVAGLTTGSEYEMQVAARNGEGLGPWSSSVTVTALGNQAPTFTETGSVTRSVAENSPAGRDVGAPVAATDPDHGKLAYSLEGTDADSFNIGGGTGQIRTKAGVTYNFEAKPTYEVTVRVNDGQGGHATIDVTINLTNVEEDLVAPGAPTFPASTDTTLTVEWTPPEDTGSPVTGYIVQYRNTTTAMQTWRSVRPTGTETTVKITRLIAEDTYEVQVRSLHGSEESPWSETTEITLGETTITFKEGSSASREVPENTAAAVAVGADIEASINGFHLRVISFSLEGTDAEAFALETPADGSARLVTTAIGYNHEEQVSYAVTVVATAGTVTARLPVTITVLDDDTEAPAAPPRPSVQPESLTSLTVTWAEPENAGPAITTYHVQYTVEGAASWTSVTNLGTGLTTTLASLTEGTTYEVQVQAVNAEGTGDWSESGTGAPGNPVPNQLPVFADAPPVTRQVPENTGAGVAVGAPVTATDEGPSIEYGLEGADGSAFTIDTATGQIRTTNAGYDHEDKSSYAVTVTATDDRQGVARLNVTIEVENLPEAPAAPGPPSVTTVSPVGVTATWAAPVDNAGRPPITRYQVQYRTPPATGTWQDWPHPDTARTVTITGLESGTAYEVQVRAINNDGPSDAELPGPWAAGTGRTSPNQPPAFTEGTSTSRTLAENPAVDVAIGAPVAATDPENHAITYTLEGTDREAFSIDDTGGLRTVATAVYDFETQPTYALDVVATDEFGAAARIAVTVTLTDVPEALSATNASAAEAAGPLVFTVTRVAAGTPVSVAWRTVNGTATAGRDYTAASGTLTFAANETEKTIRVTLLDDAISEGDETLAVTLDDPDNATVVRALGTIEDDDPVPGVSIAAATADEGAGTLVFPVTLSAIRENDAVTVAWTTADGTATAGPDYAAATGTLTFAPGETEQPLAVTLLDDEISEDNETFTVMLSDPVHGTITTATATGTIVDNDGDVAPPALREARVTSDTLTLTYDEALDPGSVPAVGDFRVNVETATLAVRAVVVNGPTVTLTLARAVTPGAQVTLTYTPGPAPLRDVAGNDAAGLSGHAVTNSPEALGPPATPAALRAERGDGQVTLTWTPARDGGSPITRYEYRQQAEPTGSYGNWRPIPDSAPNGAHATRYTVTGLTNGTRYSFQVRAVNPAGASEPSSEAHATPVDETPPKLVNVTVQGATVMLTYNEPLDETSTPSPADFTVRVAATGGTRVAGSASVGVSVRETTVAVSAVMVDGTTVTLTLARALAPGETVREISYTSGTNPLRDVAGNAAARLSAPGAPETLRVESRSSAVRLRWASARDNDSPVIRYEYQWKVEEAETYGDWMAIPDSAPGGAHATRYTVTGLTNETPYVFRVRTVTLTGTSEPSSEARATPMENAAPVVSGWLARLGRTVGTHIVDAVGERLRGAGGQGSQVTVGGYRLPLGERDATEADRAPALLEGLAGLLGLGSGPAPSGSGDIAIAAPWLAEPGLAPRLGQSRPLNVDLRRILLGSSFRLTLGADDDDEASASRLTAWGRVAGTTFDGLDGDLSLAGDVLTGTLGVDAAWERWLAGLAVSHSRSEGVFSAVAGGQGDLDTTLTSVHPYLRYKVNERVDLWGVLGYGWGELTLNQAQAAPLKTDTALLMGAVGGRGVLLPAEKTGGFQLATRTDAMLTRMTSEAVAGLDATDADAHRLRLILEGSRGVTWDEGQSLTPTVELGVRHDWGDAETGFGLEVGGRVQYADPGRGLTVEGAVRGLLAHEDEAYQEWGASGTVRLAPGPAGQGLAMLISPTWGAATSGVEGLWTRQTTAGLAGGQNQGASGGRLAVEVGYGLSPISTGLLTPYAGMALAEGADRTYRVGARWTDATGLSLSLEGIRQEPVGQQPLNQGLQLQAAWSFLNQRAVYTDRFSRGRHSPSNAQAAPEQPPSIMDKKVAGALALRVAPAVQTYPGVPAVSAVQPRAVAPPPPAQPTPSRKRVSVRRYFVQLGAFSRQANAIRARKELTVALWDVLRHHESRLGIASPKRPGLWRVVLARSFTTRQAATALCRIIKAHGTDCYVERAWRVPGRDHHGLRVEARPKGLAPNRAGLVSSRLRSRTQ